MYSDQPVLRIRRSLTRRVASLNKALKRIETLLDEARNAEIMSHQADLIKSVLHKLPKHPKEIVVTDWEQEGKEITISLDPMQSPQELMQRLYRRSHRLIRGLPKLEAEYQEILQRHNQAADLLAKFDAGQTVDLIQQPGQKKQISETKVHKPYRSYKAANGDTILVGKNAESNQLITFQIAKGKDLWLHAEGVAGSHVLIRSQKDQVDPSTLEEAALLAAYFSKKRLAGAQITVCVAKRCDLFRKKGMKQGEALMRTHTSITVVLDKERLQALLNRQT